MSGRRRAGLGIVAGLGLVAAVVGWTVIGRSRHTHSAAVVFDERTPMPALIEALRQGDARALVIIFPRISGPEGGPPKAVGEAEGKDLLEVLQSMRVGFLRFGSFGRISTLRTAGKILERLAVEGAPGHWFEALRPAHDLYASGLADADASTRITSLNEVGKFWSWFPGRSMMEVEETTLIEWKAALYQPVLRCLGERQAPVRGTAVACLSQLPDDEAAAKALAYLDDRSEGGAFVRKQVLTTFARRPALLTEDMVLKQLQDPDPEVATLAEIVLKTRGLTEEQIELGRLIFDPKAAHRALVIPRLRNRSDIDPIVWLLQLSHDPNEEVRGAAIGALGERLTPDVLKRLGEMAQGDESPAVRAAALKHLPETARPKPPTVNASPIPMPKPRPADSAESFGTKPEATVALPPLPGSPSLNPKAN